MTKHKNYEKEIKEIVLKNFEGVPATIFLFGSRAKGNNKYNSDYDIGIESDKKIDLRLLFKTQDELDKLLVKVDLVDFKRKDETFKNIAKKNIKVWKSR